MSLRLKSVILLLRSGSPPLSVTAQAMGLEKDSVKETAGEMEGVVAVGVEVTAEGLGSP